MRKNRAFPTLAGILISDGLLNVKFTSRSVLTEKVNQITKINKQKTTTLKLENRSTTKYDDYSYDYS